NFRIKVLVQRLHFLCKRLAYRVFCVFPAHVLPLYFWLIVKGVHARARRSSVALQFFPAATVAIYADFNTRPIVNVGIYKPHSVRSRFGSGDQKKKAQEQASDQPDQKGGDFIKVFKAFHD
ncbi:hypothetical protein OFN31_26555, partial [Escherichia coli]|nr:hypothetical protein [Escherichia coli]